MTKTVYMALSLALMAGCGHTHSHDHASEAEPAEAHAHSEGEIVFTPQQAAAAGVKVETVTAGPFAEVTKVGGYVEVPAGGETVVSAPAAGIVTLASTARVEGQSLAGGATVARISAGGLPGGDPVEQARVAYETARLAYERGARLVADRIISQAQYESLRADYESARLAYEAQADGHTADGVAVKSPSAGYVKQVLVQQGEYVDVGQPLLILSSDRRMQLRAELPGRYFDRLGSVRSARFRTPYDDRVYDLDSLDGRLVACGRTTAGSPYVPVVFDFAGGSSLVPGTAVEVWLVGTERQDVLSVPRSALTEEQGLYYVYVRTDDDAYRKQEVWPASDDGLRVAVARGLEGGEQVVVEGAVAVKLASLSGALPEGHSHEH